MTLNHFFDRLHSESLVSLVLVDNVKVSCHHCPDVTLSQSGR